MNDELQKQIADILKKAMEAAQKGGEWIGGQIPDVLHQLIVWTITKGIVFVLLTVITFVACAVLFRKGVNAEFDSEPFYFIPGGIIGFVGLISIPFSIDAGMDAMQAWVAPKLFLLEYAAHLMR